jgi:GT2 family glycosyltransferase
MGRTDSRETVGNESRTHWLYRGIRWRVVGQGRRLYWLARRFRGRWIAQYRRVNGTGRFGPSTFRSAFVVLRAQLALGPTREVFDELEARFADVLDAAGLSLGPADRFAGFRRLRFRRRMFARLPGVAHATGQVTQLGLPARWDRHVAAEISDARIVELSDDHIDPDSMVWTVLPVLVSGRPVAMAASSESAGPSRLPVHRTLDLLQMDEHGLARVALEQLRALLVDPLAVDGSRRPRVSVVLSTNRPDLVRDAISRIQRQRSVDIELLVGCHGFAPEELADVELEGGAVTDATVLGFDGATVFGDVLRVLSDHATAPFLAKWDDDDLYGPHHVVDLWLFSVLARAPLVGKAAEFVLLESTGLLVRRRGGSIHRSTHFLAGGALLMSKRGLDLVGGWGSIRRSVDQDVIRRFDAHGLPPFRTHGYEFVLVRHDRGHTWHPEEGYFEAAADEIRSVDALAISHVVEPEESTPEVERLLRDAPTFEICVPNQNQPTSVQLFERQRLAMPVTTRLTVCDDRSDPPLVSSAGAPEVQVVRAPAGSGFGAGRSRHAAFEHSDADVLVFADADMFIEPRVIGELAEVYRSGFVGAVHAEILFTRLTTPEVLALSTPGPADGLPGTLERRKLPGQEWRQRHWAAAADYAHPISSSYRATVGAFLTIDRHSYVATGGFRDVPVRGVEDVEFGYRLQASGCPQRLWRGGGVWHLGERTFAAHVDPVEEDAKHMHLSAYVPIWARTLDERRTALGPWGGDIVPFVELPAGSELVEELDDHFGVGAAIAFGASTSMLSAPFAYADSLSPAHATRSIDAAYRAFRNRRGGEVVVVAKGKEVARFFSLWAVNLAVRRAGGTDVSTGAPSFSAEMDPERLVRRDFGTTVVAID